MPLVLTAMPFARAWAQQPAGSGQYGGYLFAYFEDRDGSRANCEQIRFALSENGTDWHALNHNRAVIASDTISNSGGIRDPHILRGDDGKTFYMVATDMSTARNGWKKNPGIVMLRSADLVNWSHSAVSLSETYPERFADAHYVWAPQTIYDEKAGKYMVYFSLNREGDKRLRTYCAYANADFTGFEGEPELLFDSKHGHIDADIVRHGGLYHFFFKTDDGKKQGIQRAVSKELKGPYKEDGKFIDSYAGTRTHVEGSCVFRLNGGNRHVLMYDLYGTHRYRYQVSDDGLRTFSRETFGFTKDFNPRHGTAMPVTREEMDRLYRRFGTYEWEHTGNPLVRHKFSADPATFVSGDTLWLWTGEDRNGRNVRFSMSNWSIYSTPDMRHWTEHATPLSPSDFRWAENRAYASQCVARGGKYYCYVSTDRTGIGVAVADRPEGPYRDALGKPLLTARDCFASRHWWCCIDPSVIIDDDGQAWLFWGNRECYYVRLKENMTETDGEIRQVRFDGMRFTEAPWIHKRGSKYYLSYATGDPERIAYAMADSIEGPWRYMGIINEWAGNCVTNHQAIQEFKGKWYFFYHNGVLQHTNPKLVTCGGSHNRSVCFEELEYNADGSIVPVRMTSEDAQP